MTDEDGRPAGADPDREGDGSVRARVGSARDRSLAALSRTRTDAGAHALALGVAAAVGLAAAWVHWLGLVLAGALVGLVSRDLPRAVAGGLALGALVLVVFALALGGAAPRALEMTPASYVTVASAFGLPALGALARGIV